MEKVNLNFHGTSNIIQSICWILSIISWLLLIIVGMIGIFSFNKEKIIWTTESGAFIQFPSTNIFARVLVYYAPSQMCDAFIYITYIILMILVTVGFVVYILFSTFMKNKDDGGLFNGMFGAISRFHFIPLICASALFMIGLTYKDSESPEGLIIASFCFSLIGLCCVTLIYLTIKLNSNMYINCIIKKGVFSSLIVFFLYSTLNSIIKIGLIGEMERISEMNFLEISVWFLNLNDSSIMKFMKNCRIAIPLAIGNINISLAFGLKDVFIAFMNLLIFIGCAITFFQMDDTEKKAGNIENDAEGIIDIIFIVSSVVGIVALVLLFKKKLLN